MVSHHSKVLTVMFTDIAGYTERTSSISREELLQLLNIHDQLLKPIITHFAGQLIKTIGDAFLVVFESPTNAILCAAVIQKKLKEYNDAKTPENQLKVRIAINSGEVELKDNDIFGEPVNIAARIEGITDPSEIYFTESVYLSMNKAEVPTSEVGYRVLKGIQQPIKVYRVVQDEDSTLYQNLINKYHITLEANRVSQKSKKNSQADIFFKPTATLQKKAKWKVWHFVLIIFLLVFGIFFYRNHDPIATIQRAISQKDFQTARAIVSAFDHPKGDQELLVKTAELLITSELDDLIEKKQWDKGQEYLERCQTKWEWLKTTDHYKRLYFAMTPFYLAENKDNLAIDRFKAIYSHEYFDAEIAQFILKHFHRYDNSVHWNFISKVLMDTLKNKAQTINDVRSHILLFLKESSPTSTNIQEMKQLIKEANAGQIFLDHLNDDSFKFRVNVYEVNKELITKEQECRFHMSNLLYDTETNSDYQIKALDFIIVNAALVKGYLNQRQQAILLKKLPNFGALEEQMITYLSNDFYSFVEKSAREEFLQSNFFERLQAYKILNHQKQLTVDSQISFHLKSAQITEFKYFMPSSLKLALDEIANNFTSEQKDKILNAFLAKAQEDKENYRNSNMASWSTNAEANEKLILKHLSSLKPQ